MASDRVSPSISAVRTGTRTRQSREVTIMSQVLYQKSRNWRVTGPLFNRVEELYIVVPDLAYIPPLAREFNDATYLTSPPEPFLGYKPSAHRLSPLSRPSSTVPTFPTSNESTLDCAWISTALLVRTIVCPVWQRLQTSLPRIRCMEVHLATSQLSKFERHHPETRGRPERE